MLTGNQPRSTSASVRKGLCFVTTCISLSKLEPEGEGENRGDRPVANVNSMRRSKAPVCSCNIIDTKTLPTAPSSRNDWEQTRCPVRSADASSILWLSDCNQSWHLPSVPPWQNLFEVLKKLFNFLTAFERTGMLFNFPVIDILYSFFGTKWKQNVKLKLLAGFFPPPKCLKNNQFSSCFFFVVCLFSFPISDSLGQSFNQWNQSAECVP